MGEASLKGGGAHGRNYQNRRKTPDFNYGECQLTSNDRICHLVLPTMTHSVILSASSTHQPCDLGASGIECLDEVLLHGIHLSLIAGHDLQTHHLPISQLIIHIRIRMRI